MITYVWVDVIASYYSGIADYARETGGQEESGLLDYDQLADLAAEFGFDYPVVQSGNNPLSVL